LSNRFALLWVIAVIKEVLNLFEPSGTLDQRTKEGRKVDKKAGQKGRIFAKKKSRVYLVWYGGANFFLTFAEQTARAFVYITQHL